VKKIYFFKKNIMTTKDPKDTKTDEQKKVALVKLDAWEIAKIEDVFSEAKDFREVGERITKPIDNIIAETAIVIDNDPIMNVSGELEKMNDSVQGVYEEIINNDGVIMRIAKSIPLIWNLAKTLDKKFDEASFNMKWVEWKIETIFEGFDVSYDSVNKSIDLQKNFLDGIDNNLSKVIAYKEFIDKKIEELRKKIEETDDEKEKNKLSLFLRNVEFFQGNLVVLIGNLDMARKRLLMRLDSANKLSLAMSSSRPIFKTLLSTAIIETSSQKAIDASMKAMDVMGKTIDKMSSELTDKAIEWNKKAEEMSSKPVVSTSVFIENVTKLKNHFDEIEDFRQKIAEEAEKERKVFAEAKERLENIKVLNKADTEEFNKMLVEGKVK